MTHYINWSDMKILHNFGNNMKKDDNQDSFQKSLKD